MTQTHKCESCGMASIGAYCEYCIDDTGKLQPFEERFARMVDWMLSQNPRLDRASAESKTLAHMATLPAWKNHPRVKAAAASRH